MILQKLFDEYGYCNITKKENASKYKLSVEAFYKGDEIPNELKYLYISKTCDELFIILDGRDQNIKELCEKWDQKISIFIAFGSDKAEVTLKIKYNVIQVILCNDNIEDRSEEGSLNVSRKILLPCTIDQEGNIVIPDTEVVEIPFYIVPVGGLEANFQLVSILKQYIPDSKIGELDFLNYPIKKVNRSKSSSNKLSKSFTADQFVKVKEWLGSYDHSDN